MRTPSNNSEQLLTRDKDQSDVARTCHLHSQLDRTIESCSRTPRQGAGCIVIRTNHHDSAADELIDDAGFLPKPTVDAVADTLRAVLNGQSPPTGPVERTQQYDWDTVAEQAESAY